MQTSDQLGELAAALAKAQGAMTGATKAAANPFYKSKYADLASCWDACRGPLAANGLAVIQTTSASESGVAIHTLLAHSSGQWVRDTLLLMPKDTSPQAIGSAVTYGRRYGLSAIVGLAQIDDDGNAASGKSDYPDSRPPLPPLGDVEAAMLDKAFNEIRSLMRGEMNAATTHQIWDRWRPLTQEQQIRVHNKLNTKERRLIARIELKAKSEPRANSGESHVERTSEP